MDLFFIIALIMALGVIFIVAAIVLTREKGTRSSRPDGTGGSDGGFWAWFDGTSGDSHSHHHHDGGGGHHGGHHGGGHHGGFGGGGHHGGGFSGGHGGGGHH